MNYSKLLIALLVLVSAIGCSHMEKVDQNYTATDPDFHKSYANKKSECAAASVKTIKEMGADIEKQSDSEIISTRYDAYQFVRASGNAYGATANVNRQQAKIYLRVSPEGKGCKVSIARVRAWNNGEEFEKIDVGFTKRIIAKPFFGELTERLTR